MKTQKIKLCIFAISAAMHFGACAKQDIESTRHPTTVPTGGSTAIPNVTPANSAPTLQNVPPPVAEAGTNLLTRNNLVILAGDTDSRAQLYATKLAAQTNTLLQGWLIPKVRMVGAVSEKFAVGKVAHMDPFVDQIYKDEMLKISQLLGVEYKYLLLGNSASDLGQLIAEWNIFGCSTFAVLPARSATGTMIVGRNLDYKDSQILRANWTPVVFEIPGKLRFFSVHLPGLTGVLTGINEKGVMISIKVSHGATTSSGTPSAFIFRKVLENANSADEAVAIYTNHQRTVALNIQISDPQKAYELEIDALNYDVRSSSPAGIVYGANHFDSDKMRNSKKTRDFRWPILAAAENTQNLLSFEDVKTVIANAAGLEPNEKRRAANNILSVFVVYGKDLKDTAVYFGGDPENKGIAARGLLNKVFFAELFPALN